MAGDTTGGGLKRRPRGIPPRCELRKVAHAASVSTPPLDLIHLTAVGAARRIIEAKQIDATKCRVFEADLVYFFVGRPAYKMKTGNQKSDQVSRFPAVFVVRHDALGAPQQIYPFDTGAAHDGWFDKAADPFVWLDDYELEPNTSAVRKHITWAFGDNRSYYEGELRGDVEETLEYWDLVARGYLKIAHLASRDAQWPDKRASAIEVAYGRHVPLRDNVELVVLPKQFIEGSRGVNAPLVDLLNRQNVEWRLYDWAPNEAPDYYSEQIEEIIRDYLLSVGQL